MVNRALPGQVCWFQSKVLEAGPLEAKLFLLNKAQSIRIEEESGSKHFTNFETLTPKLA